MTPSYTFISKLVNVSLAFQETNIPLGIVCEGEIYNCVSMFVGKSIGSLFVKTDNLDISVPGK